MMTTAFSYTKKNLLNAVKGNSEVQVKKILSMSPELAGLKYDSDGNSILMIAIQYGCSDNIIDLILRAGCSPDLKNKYDQTAIMMACNHGSKNKIIKRLIEYNVFTKAGKIRRITLKDKNGNTSFDYAKDKPSIYKLLGTYTVDPATIKEEAVSKLPVPEKKTTPAPVEEPAEDQSPVPETEPAVEPEPQEEPKAVVQEPVTQPPVEEPAPVTQPDPEPQVVPEPQIVPEPEPEVEEQMLTEPEQPAEPDVAQAEEEIPVQPPVEEPEQKEEPDTVEEPEVETQEEVSEPEPEVTEEISQETEPEQEQVSEVDPASDSVQEPETTVDTAEQEDSVPQTETVIEIPAEPQKTVETEISADIEIPDIDYYNGNRPEYLFDEIETESLKTEENLQAIKNTKVRILQNPDALDNVGRTRLMNAIMENDDRLCYVLLESGANPNARDREGWTPLMYACRYSKSAERVQLLLEYGASINVNTNFNISVLQIAAAYCQNRNVLSLLLSEAVKENISIQDSFISAIKEERPEEIIREYLKHNIKINAMYKGKTPLMYAAEYYESTAVIKLLLDKGADPYIISSEKKNAFSYAKNNPKIVHDAVYWSLNVSSSKKR